MTKNTIFDRISLSSSLNENFFTQNLQRKSKHTFYYQFFFLEIRASYKTMLIITVQSDRPQVTK